MLVILFRRECVKEIASGGFICGPHVKPTETLVRYLKVLLGACVHQNTQKVRSVNMILSRSMHSFWAMGSANERRRYIVTSSLIGWAHSVAFCLFDVICHWSILPIRLRVTYIYLRLIICTKMFFRLHKSPQTSQQASFTDRTRLLQPWQSFSVLKPLIISHNRLSDAVRGSVYIESAAIVRDFAIASTDN